MLFKENPDEEPATGAVDKNDFLVFWAAIASSPSLTALFDIHHNPQSLLSTKCCTTDMTALSGLTQESWERLYFSRGWAVESFMELSVRLALIQPRLRAHTCQETSARKRDDSSLAEGKIQWGQRMKFCD